MSEIKFYFDESVELSVSIQAAASGLEVVSVHSLELLGDEDINHLKRAAEMGYVLCTYDTDFLKLAKEFPEHSGIIFASHQKATIGGWLRELRALHALRSAEDVAGEIIYLSAR